MENFTPSVSTVSDCGTLPIRFVSTICHHETEDFIPSMLSTPQKRKHWSSQEETQIKDVFSEDEPDFNLVKTQYSKVALLQASTKQVYDKLRSLKRRNPQQRNSKLTQSDISILRTQGRELLIRGSLNEKRIREVLDGSGLIEDGAYTISQILTRINHERNCLKESAGDVDDY